VSRTVASFRALADTSRDVVLRSHVGDQHGERAFGIGADAMHGRAARATTPGDGVDAGIDCNSHDARPR
jgi:hypothetical protein